MITDSFECFQSVAIDFNATHASIFSLLKISACLIDGFVNFHQLLRIDEILIVCRSEIVGDTLHKTATVHVLLYLLYGSKLCESLKQRLDGRIKEVEGCNLPRIEQSLPGISQRHQCAPKVFHRIFQIYVGPRCSIGSGLHVVASLRHLLTDDGTDGFRHVARLCHLFLDFRGTQSEVVKNHQRLTTKTRDYRFHEIIYRLACVLCLLLGECKHRTQFFDRQFEVVELHRRLHQFEIRYGSMRSFTEIVEQSWLI